MTRITEWLRVLQADYKPQSRKQQNTPFGVSTGKKSKSDPIVGSLMPDWSRV